MSEENIVIKRTRGITNNVSLIAAAGLVFALGVFFGHYTSFFDRSTLTDSRLGFVSVENGKRQLTFPTFWQAWDQLHQKFNGQLDDQKLFYGAVAGMVQAAGDPYTVFMDPTETKHFDDAITGSFSGVGIEIGLQKGLVTVIAPLDGLPAQKAGIRSGDVIVAVNKETIQQDSNLDEIVDKIRGPIGTKVALTVLHKDAHETSDIEITRDTIKVESVKTEIKDGIDHINITSFNADTADRFDVAAQEAVKEHVKGIILDLRDDPGGYLQSAVKIASRFLPKDTLVVSERGVNVTEYKSEGNTILQGIPVVILANGGSASASEILAGALHDQRDIPIVGTKTFGKGSVQELNKLDDGSSLKVTVAKWFTPKGRNINKEGIDPTVNIDQKYDDKTDKQLERAKEELQKAISAK